MKSISLRFQPTSVTTLKKSILLIWLLLLTTVGFATTTSAVVLNPDQEIYNLINHTEIYLDPTHQLTIQQISSPQVSKNFIPLKMLKNKRQYDVTSWIRFRVNNPSNNLMYLFLTQKEPKRAKGWILYTKNQAGQFIPLSAKRGTLHLTLFLLQIPAHSSKIFYLSDYTESFVPYNFFLEKPYNYIIKAIDNYFILGIQYGIPIALLLHSFVIFLFLRDKSYLIYIAFVLAFLMSSVLKDGLVNRIPGFALSDWLFIHAFRFSIVIMIDFYILFAKSILQSRKYAPHLNFFMNIYLLISIPLGILAWVQINNFYLSSFYNDLQAYSHGIFAAIGVILSLATALVVTIKGYKPAKYYLAGMICLLVGLLTYIITELEILPRIGFFLQTANFGMNLDMILQAIALAVRFNLIQESEIQAQQEIIRQKELNASIQKKALLEQQELTRSYARFFPHRFLELLHKKIITELSLGDQIEKQMTVLFADLRNFTTILEKKNPQESFKFINAYLNKIGPLIRKHDGFIDKYVGDAILALFEAKADHALFTAIDIIHSLQHHSKNDSINMGIGIHYGSLTVGTIGEKKRMDATVISDIVNTASRLESLNKLYGTHIIITEQVMQVLQDRTQFKLRFIDHLYVKGKQLDIKIYEVYDVDPPEIVEKKIALIPTYETAIALYQKRQFQEALSHFKQCQQVLLTDKTCDLYMKRCNELLQSPPPETWQPIGKFQQIMKIIT